MPMLERVTMIEPGTGRVCSVPVRDQHVFKERGYKFVKGSKIPGETAPSESDARAEGAEAEPASSDGEGEEGSGLAVESRAFEQPHRETKPVRRRSK